MSCVTREVTLPLDAEQAWETVTELEDWLVDDADLELEPGAEGTLTLPDGEERTAAYVSVNNRISRLLPAVPLAHPVSAVAVDDSVASFPLTSTGFEDFNEVRLNPED